MFLKFGSPLGICEHMKKINFDVDYSSSEIAEFALLVNTYMLENFDKASEEELAQAVYTLKQSFDDTLKLRKKNMRD